MRAVPPAKYEQPRARAAHRTEPPPPRQLRRIALLHQLRLTMGRERHEAERHACEIKAVRYAGRVSAGRGECACESMARAGGAR